jgi:hypothetical protein
MKDKRRRIISRPLSRRTFLRGAGVALSLPLLDSMRPAIATAEAKESGAGPRRLVAIETNMGILPQYFFPEQPGREFALTPYLEIVKDFRQDLTVFSGVSHPDVDGGHQAETAFLTAAPHPGSGAFRNTISLDQFAAERIGSLTRFSSFTLLVSAQNCGTLSFTRSGVAIPGETSPAALYRRMFVEGPAEEIDARVQDLRVGRSVLDFVNDSAKRLERELGPRDRQRLDQYFTSIRDLEQQLISVEEWERRPKPKVAAPPPEDVADTTQLLQRLRLMFDMVRLALETDSTRLVTMYVNPANVVPAIPGVTRETHALSHHGNQPETLAELRKIEEAQFQVLAELLAGLRGVQEENDTLLDRTMVLYGTCMGSANAHSNTNLPVLLAGGGFRHGQHLAFDRQRNYPLANLFLSMLERLDIALDKFASSTGTMRGLELA